MIEVEINNRYTTQKDIENCIKAFYLLPLENSQLQIKFIEQIDEIDILLIAYLILFKELKPNLKITVELNFDVNDGLKSRLYQYLIYAFLMTGKSVFTIKKELLNNNEGQNEFYINENSPPHYFQQYFALSESFMPILMVGKLPNSNGIDLYDLLFKEKVEGVHKIPKNVDFNKNDKQQYQNLNRLIKGYFSKKENRWTPGIIDPSKRLECISYLSRLAFYNALRQAKITRFYLFNNEETWKSLRIDDISYSKNKDGNYPQIEFYKDIKWIFDDLSFHPPIYHFVYSQLLSSELLPGTFNNGNKGVIIKILHSLWDYTKDMVDGINELAKNIREHAKPSIGAITGRIYKEEKWAELKKSIEDTGNIFDSYLNKLRDNLSAGSQLSFFDLNVIDLGEKGIIETLKVETEKLIDSEYLDESVRNFISEDVQALKNGEIKLKHFLDPSLGNTLNQQSKKAIAHLGLLIFSNLIKANDGLLRSGSRNCEPFRTYLGISSSENIPVQFGTNYQMVLPISVERKIKTLLPHALDVPLESTLIEIKGIEVLLDYELKNLKDNKVSVTNTPGNSRYIYYISIDRMEFANKTEEIKLWNDVNSNIDKKYSVQTGTQRIFFCIDFENLQINESQLFRFLGLWNLNYANSNLILTNIKTEVFEKLIKTNEYFFDKIKKNNDDAIYWNENSVMLIYSYCEPRENKERFYFTDILWGKEKLDFYLVNKLIKKTNFNSTTIFMQNDNDQQNGNNQKYDNRLSLITQSGFFHSKTTLLPFDLLLPGNNGLTLFEHNASVLLQNHLKLQENNNRNNE